MQRMASAPGPDSTPTGQSRPFQPTPVAWSVAQDGNWQTAADWSTGAVPTRADAVSIAAPGSYTVAIDAPASAYALSVSNDGATLSIAAALVVATELDIQGAEVEAAKGASIRAGTTLFTNEGGLLLDAGASLRLVGTLRLGSGAGDPTDAAVLSGPGVLTTTGTSVISGNGDNYTNPELYLGDGISWTNTGTVQESGVADIMTAANQPVNIVNAPGATFDILPNANINVFATGLYLDQGTATFTNRGTLALTENGFNNNGGGEIDPATTNDGLLEVASDQSLLIEGAFVNRGTIAVAFRGTLALAGGGMLGGTMAGAGEILLQSGQYRLGAVSGDGGIIEIDGYGTDLAVAGTLTTGTAIGLEYGGTLILPKHADLVASGGLDFGLADQYYQLFAGVTGPGTLTTSGTSTISGAKYAYSDAVFQGGATWLNTGTVYDSAGIGLGSSFPADGARIVNAAGGIFELTSDGYDVGDIGASDPAQCSFTNDGTLISVQGLFVSYGIGCPVTNAGEFDVNGEPAGVGTNGSVVLEDGFTNLAKGIINIASGGALGLNGGGVLAGTLNAPAGGLYLSFGTYALQTSSFDSSILDNAATLVDSRTITLSASARGDGALTNEQNGIFDLVGNTSIDTNGTVIFDNAGFITKSGVGSTTGIRDDIDNDGRIRIDSGTLSIAGTVSGAGIVLLGTGASLSIGGALDPTQTIRFIGGGATLALADPAASTMLTSFGMGDHLDLTGIIATTAAIGGDTLTVTTAADSYSFVSAALAGDAVIYGSDGSGGTLLTIASPSPTVLMSHR